MAGVLVSMGTPPRSPMIPRLSPASASVISSTVMTVKPVEALALATTRSLGVVEAEKEFVAEMVDSFYKSLKRSVALVLKGSTTSFSGLKVVLSRNIDSVRDFGGDDQAAALELLVESLRGTWASGVTSTIQIWTPQLMNSLNVLLPKCVKLILQHRKQLKAISSDLKSLNKEGRNWRCHRCF